MKIHKIMMSSIKTLKFVPKNSKLIMVEFTNHGQSVVPFILVLHKTLYHNSNQKVRVLFSFDSYSVLQ